MKISNKTFAMLLSLFLTLFATTGSAVEFITKTETVVVNDLRIEIVRTVDNFIVLFDSSGSMDKAYKDTGKKKVAVAKEFLKDRNRRMPPLKFNAGLYTFTPKAGSVTFKALKPYYEMKPYDKAEFAAAIDQLPEKGSGATLLQGGLYELGKILEGLEGRTAVFVFTEGRYSEFERMEKPVEIARKLASRHDVCFYVISSAPGHKEEQILEAVASINSCSRVIAFDDLVEIPEFTAGALFVIEKELVERPVQIEKIVGAKLDSILFDHDGSQIKPEYAGTVDAIGTFMRDNPSTYIILSGFADSSGNSEYNLGLSKSRAKTVGDYLGEQYGIDRHRIALIWYGDADPVADNGTEEGRSLNRRVEVIVAEMF